MGDKQPLHYLKVLTTRTTTLIEKFDISIKKYKM